MTVKTPSLFGHLWLRSLLGLSFCVALPYGLLGNTDEVNVLPLPAWSSNDGEVQVFPLGGSLWPEGYKPEEGEVPPGTDPSLLKEGGDRKLRLFIPKSSPSVKVTPSAPTPAPVQQLNEVSGEFMALSHQTKSGDYLTDPLHLLNETPAEDLRRLLEYHSGESRIRAHVLVMDTDQKLPQKLDVSKLAGGELSEGLACLIAYPLGEPWRVRMFMSRGLTEIVPPKYLQGIAQACVQDALQVSDDIEQLQRFAIQLSIRLIWLERAYPEVKPANSDEEAPAVSLAHGHGDIHEVPALVQTSQESPSWWAVQLARLSPASQARLVKVGYGVLGGLVALLVLWFIMRRLKARRRSVIWMLPENQVAPRLKAPHCGGGGAHIHYG